MLRVLGVTALTLLLGFGIEANAREANARNEDVPKGPAISPPKAATPQPGSAPAPKESTSSKDDGGNKANAPSGDSTRGPGKGNGGAPGK